MTYFVEVTFVRIEELHCLELGQVIFDLHLYILLFILQVYDKYLASSVIQGPAVRRQDL